LLEVMYLHTLVHLYALLHCDPTTYRLMHIHTVLWHCGVF
jgi:hypothetical protein